MNSELIISAISTKPFLPASSYQKEKSIEAEIKVIWGINQSPNNPHPMGFGLRMEGLSFVKSLPDLFKEINAAV
jgi:hypothetical protein